MIKSKKQFEVLANDFRNNQGKIPNEKMQVDRNMLLKNLWVMRNMTKNRIKRNNNFTQQDLSNLLKIMLIIKQNGIIISLI